MRPSGDIVRSNVRSDLRAVDGTVEGNDLDAGRLRLFHHVGYCIRVGRIEQDDRHFFLNEILHTGDLPGRIILSIDRDEAQALGLGLGLRTVAQGDKERVVQCRDRQADGGRRTGLRSLPGTAHQGQQEQATDPREGID
jgi:hypothetical protein